MTIRPRTLLAAALAGAALTAAGAVPTASAAGQDTLRYVALGDSFAAEPLVPPVDTSDPLCLRSLADYPHIAARELGARLTDVSCSGATAGHMAASQFPGTAPQYSALSEDTDVVSITVGGNDTSLVTTALSCLNLLPEPLGISCAATQTKGGTDKVRAGIDAWAPTFADVLDGIHQRAPRAKVFVVGYGDYIRAGGCFPVQPIWAPDADYIQGEVDYLSGTMKRIADRHNAVFVDTYSVEAGHDSCAAPADRWTEGLIPTHPAAPLHPNADGAKAIGHALAAAVAAPAGD